MGFKIQIAGGDTKFRIGLCKTKVRTLDRLQLGSI